VFALTQLLGDPRALHLVPAGPEGLDVRELSGLEIRFPVKGVNPLRLPKAPAAAVPALVACGDADALLWTALTAPSARVPLAQQGSERRAATACAVRAEGGDLLLAVAVVAVRPGPTKYSPPELTSLTLRQASDKDSMLDLLGSLWGEAEPAARAAAGGADAVWLGGNLAQIPGASVAVEGCGAALGLAVELVPDAHCCGTRLVTTAASGSAIMC
jgi:hypothetical protein